jgi:hypothetical protein
MLMSTGKLVALRLFTLTLGRSPLANRVLRRLLVEVLVHRRARGEKYVASSRYFDPREL